MNAPLPSSEFIRGLVRDVFDPSAETMFERDRLRVENAELCRETARLREQLAEVREDARSLMRVIGSPEFVIGAGFLAICEGER